MFVVGFDDGSVSVQCSGPGPTLAYLGRGGCRLLSGDREVLLDLLAQQEKNVLEGIGEELARPVAQAKAGDAR